MTNKDLIEILKRYPPEAKVYYKDGEHLGSTSEVRRIDYQIETTLARQGNTLVIE